MNDILCVCVQVVWWWLADMEEEDCVVRLRGLPWSTKPEEIIKFLEGASDNITCMIVVIRTL